MKETTIDCSLVRSREDLHRLFQESLCFPEWYGSNLDALWDIATTFDADMTLIYPGDMLNALTVYGCKIISTLYEAAEKNPNFVFRIEN